jgi:GTP-binding protein
MSDPLKLEFVTSAPDVHKLPPTRAEVAVIGRSNVGKSSLLNALTGRKNLAKISSKPGKTQLLNCFRTESGATVVDLPGYGYASTASKVTRRAWRERMERYLATRDRLLLTLALVDGEIGPTKLDLEMLEWLRANDLAFQIVATKHDKVKSSKRVRRKRDLAEACGVDEGDVIWVSVTKNVGIDRVRALLRQALG